MKSKVPYLAYISPVNSIIMLINNYSVIFATGKASDNIVNIILGSAKFFEVASE